MHPMLSEYLHVFTARSNPLGWRRPHEHYQNFAAHMLDCGVYLHVIECAYGEEPFTCHELPEDRHRHERFKHVGVRATTRGWNKENLLNIGIRRAPEAKYIAWVDADILFRGNTADWSANWAAKTVRALQHYAVVQPWSDCLDLGPQDEIIAHHKSFCWQHFHKHPVVPQSPKFWHGDGGPYAYPHSGYAWAMTRPTYDALGGLFEVGGMGSGDHHMALALVGHADASMPSGTHPRYREHVKRWEHRALHHVNHNIGVVKGTIEHAFHGRKGDRGYLSRWGMFVHHQFNPDEDLKRNAFDVLEFATNKPPLRHDFDLYLHSRNEDLNCLI